MTKEQKLELAQKLLAEATQEAQAHRNTATDWMHNAAFYQRMGDLYDDQAEAAAAFATRLEQTIQDITAGKL